MCISYKDKCSIRAEVGSKTERDSVRYQWSGGNYVLETEKDERWMWGINKNCCGSEREIAEEQHKYVYLTR